MNEIVRHIECLLITHDCVVVQGFGAFLAHNVEAKFSEDNSVLLPPRRIYSFNPSLKHNDGILATSISRAKSIPFEDACNFVSVQANNLLKQLHEQSVLPLGKIGTLSLSEEGSLRFMPCNSQAMNPFLWFAPVPLHPVADVARERAASINEKIGIKNHSTSTVTYISRIAAGIAVLFALGLILSTPIGFDNVQQASIALEQFKPTHKVSNRQTAPIILNLLDHPDACEVVDTAKHNTVAAGTPNADTFGNGNAITELHSSSAIRFDENDKYRLVIASLVTEADAIEFVDTHKKHKLGILSKDGRYRVFAATGSTLAQAQSMAADLSADFPDAWVCRK